MTRHAFGSLADVPPEPAFDDRLLEPRAGVGLPVRTSSYCSTGGCVGVRFNGDVVDVVDTKIDGSSSLTFTRDEWAAFVAGVKNGEFDLDGGGLPRRPSV